MTALAVLAGVVFGAVAGAWLGMRHVARLMRSQFARRFDALIMSDTHAARLTGSYCAYGRTLHFATQHSLSEMRGRVEREMEKIEFLLRERAVQIATGMGQR